MAGKTLAFERDPHPTAGGPHVLPGGNGTTPRPAGSIVGGGDRSRAAPTRQEKRQGKEVRARGTTAELAVHRRATPRRAGTDDFGRVVAADQPAGRVGQHRACGPLLLLEMEN